MTHNNHENLAMMDAVTTKYGKTTFVTVSKTLAIILVFIFFICLAATGLLVYSFTSTCPKNDTHVPVLTQKLVCDYSAVTSDIKTSTNETPRSPSTLPTTFTTASPPTNFPEKKLVKNENIRLPKAILPDSYRINLIPFIEEGNFTFHGEETVTVNVTHASWNVTLHSVGLTILAVNVMNSKNESISVKDVRNIEKKQFMVIDLDGVLEAGQQYFVYIKFKGILNNMLQGFYRSSYVENNVTRWIAATQFQPTDARKAFPCFDEPGFKAKFQINIAHSKNMTAISNMPKIRTIPYVKNLPNYIWDQFEESLPMSTYLVAFLISDFQNITKGTFSVWARSSALSQAKFALETAPLILRYYEKFFGIPYPLPKIDMVAIPDFSAGAMENWGLITYREPVLLYEEGVSSITNKQRIAHVIAHELAHQWFGNLVTPLWWEDLWLNEGFATYVEFLGADSVNAKWKDLELFLVTELQEALKLDALKSSHPISVRVNNPEEVNDIFDRISYSKGASIIRMMKDFLGDRVFHSGLNRYLKRRMFKNAAQDDLWQILTEKSIDFKVLPGNSTVKEIMDTWTLQIGFPVVNATLKNGNLIITQERFLVNRQKGEKDETLWWIPITILDNMDKKQEIWLKNKRQITIPNAFPKDNSWFLLNVHQNGYYRVNYDETNWKALIHQLLENGHHLIHPTNRAQMIDDAMNLAFSGYLGYDIALNVTLYLVNEREYVPWKAALSNFHFLYNMIVKTGHFDKFRMYLITLIRDFYLELTFNASPNEDSTKILNRMEIIEYACKLGIKDCILQAVQFFQNWRNSADPDKENLINPDLRQTIYCTAIGEGGPEEWDFAWNRYLRTNVAGDKEILLNSLACSKDIWILSRYLEWSITENSGIRKHDVARVFASLTENPVAQDLVYRFLKINWKKIRDYLGSTSMSLSSLVRTSTEKFNSQEEIDDLKLFFERNRNEFGVATRTIQQSIEQAEANTRWMEQNFDVVKKWLHTARVE